MSGWQQDVNLPRIGILGGMGPAATILLQQRILDAKNVAEDGGHIPLFVDMNPQVPSRINYLVHGQGDNPGPVLSCMARRLEQCGVHAIAMPCCTAHHFADEIEASISIPFLNMVRMTAMEVASYAPQGSEIGILASPATKTIGLFKHALQPFRLNALYPKDLNSILSTIESIKQSGPQPHHVELMQHAMAELIDVGAKAIIIGCSEFSLISRQLESVVPMVDAVDVLASHIVQLTENEAELTSVGPS